MRLLKLVLSAPLQSWGEDARWDQRTTAPSPTKSGVIGLLGCCLGYPRGDQKLQELDTEVHMAVRIDRAGMVITDYQTVQGTEEQGILNAEGKRRCDTIVTPKSYLQEAYFTVFLWGNEQKLEECYRAMRSPVWTPFLGRRSCPPAIPLLPEWAEAASIEEALRSKDGSSLGTTVQYEIELLPGKKPLNHECILERPDKVVQSEQNKYSMRRVRSGSIVIGG